MKNFFKFLFLFMVMIAGYAILVTVSIGLLMIIIYVVITLAVETVIAPSLPVLVADVLVIICGYQLIKSNKFKNSMKELWLQIKRNL